MTTKWCRRLRTARLPIRAPLPPLLPPTGPENSPVTSTAPALHLSARTPGMFPRAASHRCTKQSRTEVGFSSLAHLLVHQTARNWAGKNNSQKNYLCQKISGAALNQARAVPERRAAVFFSFFFFPRRKYVRAGGKKLQGIIQITWPVLVLKIQRKYTLLLEKKPPSLMSLVLLFLLPPDVSFSSEADTFWSLR